MDAKHFLAAYLDRSSQAIEGEALRQVPGCVPLAVDQHVFPVGPEDEVEQNLALRGKEAVAERVILGELAHAIRDEHLVDVAHALTRATNERASDDGGSWHEYEYGGLPLHSKHRPFHRPSQSQI